MSEPVNPNEIPNAPSGQNPPAPEVNPDAGKSFFQPEPAPVTPKKNRAGLIAGVAVAGLLVLGGGAYAAANVVNAVGDRDIAKAVPGSSAVFFQVDLNPSTAQKASALSLVGKIDALVDEDDKYNAGDKDFKELATDPAFEELDYDTEVKPWIGDKVAIAAWGDFSGAYESEDYNANPTSGTYSNGYEDDPLDDYYDDDYLDGKYDNLDGNESKANPGGVSIDVVNPSTVSLNASHKDGAPAREKGKSEPSVVLVYEVKNKEKAKAAAEKVIEKNDEIGAYTIYGQYLVLAENDEVISDYIDSIEKGNLSADATYVSDMKTLGGDNIATGWLDISELGVDGYLANIGFDEEGEEMRGRVATGVSLTSSGVESRTKVIGVEGTDDATMNSFKNRSAGITGIDDFSSTTQVAVSIKGLPQIARAILTEYEKNDPEGAKEFIAGAKESGIDLKNDLKKIFGSETGIGYVSINDGESTKYEFRATDADKETIENLLKKAGTGDHATVKDEGDTTIVVYGDNDGKTDSGALSDNEKFKDALPELDKANAAAFVNLNSLNGSSSKKSGENKDYGVLGMTSSYNEDKDVVEITTRWIF